LPATDAETKQHAVPTVPALSDLPGHHIRRLQQIAVAIFLEETAAQGITPVQFAALAELAHQPGIDQRSLGRRIGFDTSTIGGVIDRLQARGLVQRGLSDADRRVRLLHLTAAGQALLQQVLPPMHRAQQRMLAPLAPAERPEFMRMLRQLVEANNQLSRAPSDS
jgi:DNA-binding MarR family transcriptional regulator